MESKKKIAVFFGERSFEHDISILTGLQAFRAIDTTKYDPFPVYVDLDGKWWVGEKLLDTAFYPLTKEKQKQIRAAEFKIGSGKPFILPIKKGVFDKPKPIYFDFAFLAFHGGYGEDGMFQGLMEMAGIPYSGCRPLAATVFMDKIATKRICKAIGVPVLDDVLIKRPEGKDFFDVEKLVKDVKFKFPVIVKPCSLGSSIGVSKAENKDELYAAILKVFALDSLAMVEPFVPNLEEYNVSVSNVFGETSFSAIERPLKKADEVLSFADKYKAGGKSGKIGGTKVCGSKAGGSGRISAGMLEMTRALNPKELSETQARNIQKWAKAVFDEVRANGDARIDFLCNSKTGEMWLGEVNPIPGSLSYFLWEAGSPKVSFTKLVSAMIQEGFDQAEKHSDFLKTISDNRIFKQA